MHPDEKIPIRVVIADRIMPLKVARKDEEYVRLAARMINRRMEEFKEYNTGEVIDRLAWAALDYTSDLVKHLKNVELKDDTVESELQDLDQMLEGF